jgi:hypothetical protein
MSVFQFPRNYSCRKTELQRIRTFVLGVRDYCGMRCSTVQGTMLMDDVFASIFMAEVDVGSWSMIEASKLHAITYRKREPEML